MKITGAVLKECGLSKPYSQSRPIELRELELSDPDGSTLCVKVESASVCHSDLSVVNGSRARPVPLVLGHEASGYVLSTGSDVRSVKPGDRVAFSFSPHCGECDLCISTGGIRCTPALKANVDGVLLGGGTYLSDGEQEYFHHTGIAAFAEAAVVHESSVVKVDDDVPFEIAAMLSCAVLTGGGAIRNAGQLEEGETVAVVGAGGVGVAAMLVALAMGAQRVDVVDPAVEKGDSLRELGASHVFHPDDAPSDSYDLVVEAAGVPVALENSLPMLKAGGRVVSVGLPRPEAEVSFNMLDITFKSKKIIGSYHGSGSAFRDISVYSDLWKQGKLPLEKLISKRVPLSRINEAMDDLDEAKELRQIVQISSGGV